MPKAFDPYYTWLGIRPEDQPPHHYRLLGIALFEDQPQVIEHAADRQMAHIKSFGGGAHSEWSQRLLNEIAAAKLCLLVADRKAAYDAQLRSQITLGTAGSRGGPEAIGPGTIIGDFEIIDKLGAGSLGEVYRAKHRLMQRLVSLQVLRAELTKSPDIVQRFHRSVRAAARMAHPNILTALDAKEVGGLQLLVMEHAEGQDLQAILQKDGPLPVPRAVDYVLQAARGLEYAHSQGVIHRNIKPKNLLLDTSGRIRIMDLGLARFSDDVAEAESLTQAGQVIGTAEYMAPEQARDPRAVDARSDVYSLGCTLYRLLTGRAMYAGKNALQVIQAHLSQPVPSLAAACPAAPAKLVDSFQRMVAKSADERYANMGEVVAALEICQAQLAGHGLPRRPGRSRRKTSNWATHRGRLPMYITIGLALIAVAALMAFLLLAGR
jgi:serine/threonine protein kinase